MPDGGGGALALLGGAFDPFHCGHLFLARHIPPAFGCPLRVIPNGCPAHRAPPVAAFEARVEMCRRAVAGLPDVSVGTDERPPFSGYTVDTLRALRQQAPSRALLLVVGDDAYKAFGRWRQPAEILTLAHLVVAPRAGVVGRLDWGRRLARRAELMTGSGGVYVWDVKPPAVAATRCRELLSTGGDVDEMLPPAVAAYARENKLYG